MFDGRELYQVHWTPRVDCYSIFAKNQVESFQIPTKSIYLLLDVIPVLVHTLLVGFCPTDTSAKVLNWTREREREGSC